MVLGVAGEQGRPGGRGIAVACDHRDDAAVTAAAERIAAEHGRLDLLATARPVAARSVRSGSGRRRSSEPPAPGIPVR
jgi:NAD(P)-dependent dehydrogenase (short-subunit alcohol dehydrogenase family)